jgi:dCMP deaminase
MMITKPKELMNKWELYYFDVCKTIASKSKDPSTKVGSVIIGEDGEIRSTGWNGFARRVNDLPERYADREFKYKLVVHAEYNAICNAARVGIPLRGCSLYVYPLIICNECAKGIIQVGIREVFMYAPVLKDIEKLSDNIKGWMNTFEITQLMFEEANIRYTVYV